MAAPVTGFGRRATRPAEALPPVQVIDLIVARDAYAANGTAAEIDDRQAPFDEKLWNELTSRARYAEPGEMLRREGYESDWDDIRAPMVFITIGLIVVVGAVLGIIGFMMWGLLWI